MNVWGLNPEGLCLEWLMAEAIVEGVSFVECLCNWGEEDGGKRPLLKWPKQKEDRMTLCVLNSLCSFQSRLATLRGCVT